MNTLQLTPPREQVAGVGLWPSTPVRISITIDRGSPVGGSPTIIIGPPLMVDGLCIGFMVFVLYVAVK